MGKAASDQLAQYEGFSLTKAYAQQFRRSYISWADSKAYSSIIFMGRTVDRSINGMTTGRDQTTSQEFFRNRIITRYPYLPGSEYLSKSQSVDTARGDYFKKYMGQWEGIEVPEGSPHHISYTHGKPFWIPPTSIQGASEKNPERTRGAGLHKKEIADYLKRWFEGTEKEQPAEFIGRIMKESTDADRMEATLLWTYIAAGIDASAITNGEVGINQNGAAYRWERCFASRYASDVAEAGGIEPIWNDIYLSKDGLKYKDGKLLPTALEFAENGILSQVAGYLDSFLTVALMLEYNGYASKPDGQRLIDDYVKAAIAIFGQPGAYAKNPSDLYMENTLVLTKVQASNWDDTRHEAVDAFDFWRLAQEDRILRHKGFRVVEDFRSRNPYYSDWSKNPLLEESPAYQAWAANGSAETMDRINLRLASQGTNRVIRSTSDPNVEIVRPSGTKLPGTLFYGPAASDLGSERDESGAIVQDKIPRGMVESGTSFALDPTPLPMVGGQFLIGFFAAEKAKSPFTHSLHATPSEPTIVPPSDGLLNQTPILQYRLGTTFDDAKEKRAISDAQTLQSFLDSFAQLQLQNPGAQIEIRTSFSSEVKAYRSHIYGTSGSIWPTSIPAPTTEPRKPIVTETTAGTTTVPTLNLDSAPWSPISYTDLQQVFTRNTMIQYTDERFQSYIWETAPKSDPYKVPSGGTTLVYTSGLNHILHVIYYANTHIRVIDATGKEISSFSYGTGPDPIAKGQAPSGRIEEVQDEVKYIYQKEPSVEQQVKPPMPYMVYSSSPEAYAELKNWGVASTNEPGDSLGLGNGRAPVDYEAGVNKVSNGSTMIGEDYEVMAGVPTTEKLYLAIGGSEYIVDIALQYVANETAVRSYSSVSALL
jgi:hypothetical protein